MVRFVAFVQLARAALSDRLGFHADREPPMPEPESLALLRLLHLADSALPIGATPHSFGLETLAFDGDLSPPRLAAFFEDYLSEAGLLDAVFCRAAYRSAGHDAFDREWAMLNEQYAAFKPARESRAASQTLGRRLLELVLVMQDDVAIVQRALTLGGAAQCLAFGLVGCALEIDEDATVLACLHQNLAGLHSACQRLMPFGQKQASRMLWELKPVLLAVVATSRHTPLDALSSFTAMLDLASMRHPMLSTRLFIS